MTNTFSDIIYKYKNLHDIMTDRTSPNIPDYQELAFFIPPGGMEPVGVEMELVGISKQELARLKALEKRCMEEAATRARDSVTDCKILVNKLLQVKPELRSWVEARFKEYL